MCVQRFDDSLSAIHTTFRTSLRSSSMREPRDPLLKVLTIFLRSDDDMADTDFGYIRRATAPGRRRARDGPPRQRWYWFTGLKIRIADLVNDPSAGSPTETLLRLLLPLNDQV